MDDEIDRFVLDEPLPVYRTVEEARAAAELNRERVERSNKLLAASPPTTESPAPPR